ncbi:hypothetical protein VKT23_014709 [Stygiomarasmius scandens]|uniref:TauD/TfdA-like domain-containing protein n=1 Tax=Marasmiellus scandens TaxID=2682957 RepID=A0ABR1J2W4_9AGAR
MIDISTLFTPLPSEFKLGGDGKPLCASPASVIHRALRPWWFTLDQNDQASRLLYVISKFLYLEGKEDQFEISGRQYLHDQLSTLVNSQAKIELVFPAFPFKSPSDKKALGRYPDLGEEFLLRRLETLACSIEDEYIPGASIFIVSDGLVYGDILGQDDSTVYKYNAELRRICREQQLTHIHFVRVMDLFNSDPLDISSEETTLQEYLELMPKTRAQFLAHEVPSFELETGLQQDSGLIRTYRGYLKFLELDLDGSSLTKSPEGQPLSGKQQDRVRRQIAKKMLSRGARFSDLVQAKFPSAIRLSCHQHPNKGPKFALRLYPNAGMMATPWHNVLFERTDGSLEVTHLCSLKDYEYETVYKFGRPYYLREKTDAYTFGSNLDAHISFSRTYPFGLAITCSDSVAISFNELPMDKIRKLIKMHSCVVFRGFSTISREDMITKASEFGEILRWPAYGAIFEIKENPNWDVNSSLTSEAMPMHYDGVFKTKTTESGKIINDPPQFQFFQCIEATESEDGGQTLFSNTADILRNGVTSLQRDLLSSKTWTVYTPQNTVFGGDHFDLPLITRNEFTGNDVLRWHDPW